MSATETVTRLGISLGLACEHQSCTEFAFPLLRQMDSGKYDVCATMSLPRSQEAWEADHRTGRKRAWRADRNGYWAKEFNRAWFPDDIYAINTSSPYRQGRPMTTSYLGVPDTSSLPDYPCDLHAIRYYGVFIAQFDERDHEIPREILVAYLAMHRSGDLALVSQVLGHADHEPSGVMQLLFRLALVSEGSVAPGVCVYNRWDSGKDGLRQAKSWVGFEETAVEWLP